MKLNDFWYEGGFLRVDQKQIKKLLQILFSTITFEIWLVFNYVTVWKRITRGKESFYKSIRQIFFFNFLVTTDVQITRRQGVLLSSNLVARGLIREMFKEWESTYAVIQTHSLPIYSILITSFTSGVNQT